MNEQGVSRAQRESLTGSLLRYTLGMHGVIRNIVLAGVVVLLLVLGVSLSGMLNKTEPVAESWGTIVGTVLLGPTCPVVSDPPDPACADRPYETSLAITTADQSRVIKEIKSDPSGRFQVDVPPGEYAIRSSAAANVLPYCALESVIVPVNDSVEVTVNCDSGIR